MLTAWTEAIGRLRQRCKSSNEDQENTLEMGRIGNLRFAETFTMRDALKVQIYILYVVK